LRGGSSTIVAAGSALKAPPGKWIKPAWATLSPLETGKSPLGGTTVGDGDRVAGEGDAALADGVPAFAGEVGVPAPVARPPQPVEATVKAAMTAASTRLIPD
jgi:hypothetical protein